MVILAVFLALIAPRIALLGTGIFGSCSFVDLARLWSPIFWVGFDYFRMVALRCIMEIDAH